MSRSGYSEDCENLELYRASVDRALKGKRGQAFLREMAAALDAMPEKILIAGELINEQGQTCAIGQVCKVRRIDLSKVIYNVPESVAKAVGIARAMAAEIAWMNDEWCEWNRKQETPGQRWLRMRFWVAENIRE